MSKGNMFVTTAKGKIGNLVLYTRKGGQITRAYQGEVKNPKTTSQMAQRAKFANAVKFYKKAVQHFYNFAYEDQKQNETAFNAFMRHNISQSSYLTKPEVSDAYFPALGRWVMSQGSLPASLVAKFNGVAANFLNTGIDTADSTVGAVSSKLIGQGFNTGDIVTIVAISSMATSLEFDFTNYYDSGNLLQPQWDIRQFILNASDTTPISEINRLGPSLGTLNVVAGGLVYNFTNTSYCNAVAVITTRKSSGITYASNSTLVPNSVMLAMLDAAATDNWFNQVIVSWGANGDAILQGSVAGGTRSSDGSGTSGSGTTGGSTTGGSTTSSVIRLVNNGNPPVSISSSGTHAITVQGTGLSSVQPVVNGTGVTISDFSLNTDRTEATFNVVVADSYTSSTVSYMGTAVVSVGRTDGTGEDL